jgi:hypothetical protein
MYRAGDVDPPELLAGGIINVLSALRRRHSESAGPRRTPGVNWFRRGLQRSLGHAEALVLVKLEQSQT